MIDAADVHKRFGNTEVLKGASLSVRSGEVAVLVGPSGSGKSTFLRCLNGLESFDRGSIKVAEVPLSPGRPDRQAQARLLEVRRQVGMVFQQFHLFPHLTVLENVAMAPRRVLGASAEEAAERARALLHRVGLASFEERMPDRLSGGQQQRVAIARALAMQPRAVLFDEPTSALDPAMTEEVLSVLVDLASCGQTMVVVTHGMDFARRAAHRLHVFDEGRIIASGPPVDIFENPLSPRVAQILRTQTKH